MNFEQRKREGNYWEQKFEAWCNRYKYTFIRSTPFAENDFTTTTSNMTDHLKYRPDYRLLTDVWIDVEVKKHGRQCLCNWEKDECDYQREKYDVWVWVNGELHHHVDLKFEFHRGNPNYSGMDYYKVYVNS